VRTSQAFGLTGDTLLPTPSAGLLQLWDQAGSPAGQAAPQCEDGPESQIQQLQAGFPFSCSTHMSGQAPNIFISALLQNLALIHSATLKCNFLPNVF